MRYTLEVEIKKPLEEVGALFGDQDSIAKWQPGFQGIKEVDGKYLLTYKRGRKTFDMVETIKKDNLPHEFTATYEVPGMVMRVENLFTDAGNGFTRWVTNNKCDASGFMKFMMWIMPGCAKKQSLIYMNNFKALAEDGTDVRDSG